MTRTVTPPATRAAVRPAALTAIRPARSASDWEQATALLFDYLEWLRVAVGVDPVTEQPALATELADLAAEYRTPTAALHVAVEESRVIGMAAYRIHDDGSAELKRMYVRPVARGRGLADRLIESVIEAATDEGCPTIWLETMSEVMEPAISLYRRHGFVEATGDRRTIELDRMVVMERALSATEADI